MPNKKRKTQIPGVSVSIPLPREDNLEAVVGDGVFSVRLPEEIVPVVESMLASRRDGKAVINVIIEGYDA